MQEISNFWHHKAIFYLCDSSSLFILCKFSMLLLFTPGVPGESGVGLVPGEGLAVGRDGAARTRSLASCQLPRRRRCRVTAGTARGFLEQPLFLPPRRSVSMTRSNFGTRSGSAWAGPHSTPRVTRWGMTAISPALLGAAGWDFPGGDTSPPQGDFCPVPWSPDRTQV